MGGVSKLQKRAQWEMNVRAGRSQRLAITVDGWGNAEGLWHPNTLVRVKSARLQVDTTLLIVSVKQSRDGTAGTSTDLDLCDPRAMTVEPLTQQPKAKKPPAFFKGSAP